MATIDWAQAVSGTWTTAADWAGGQVPGANDTAVIDATEGRDKYTVSVTTPVTVGGLILDSSHATLSVDSTFAAASMALEKGTLLLDNGTLSGTVAETGGALKLGGTNDTLQNVTWQGQLAYTGGTSTLTISGGLTLTATGGTGPGTAELGGHVVLNGVSTLNNAAIEGGMINVQDTPTLTLGSGLSFDFTTLKLESKSVLVNNGLLESTAIIGGTLTNNGTINGQSNVAVAKFTNNGQIDVSGTFLFLDVQGLQAPGALGVINVGDNGSLVFVGSETTAQLNALFTQQNVTTSGSLYGTGISGTLNNAGATLDVGAGTRFGTFTTYYTNASGYGVVTGGTVVDEGGNGAVAGTLSNLTLQSQVATLSLGVNSELDDVTVTGATVVTASDLVLNGGTLNGVGTLSEASAYHTLVLNGVDITGVDGSGSVTVLSSDRGGLTISSAQSVAGYNIQLTGGSTLNVDSGASLNDAQATFADPGGTDYFLCGSDADSTTVTLGESFTTAITSGTDVTFGSDNYGVTTPITSMGTFDIAGSLQIGAGYYYAVLDNTGTIAVSSGGTLSVGPNGNGLTTLANGGTIASTSGVIDIAAPVMNSGLISDSFGGAARTATIDGAVTGAGTIALAGAGTLALGGTVAAGQIVQFGTTTETLDLTQAQASAGFSGTLDGFTKGDLIILGGETVSSARFSGHSIIATLSTGGSIVLATGTALRGALSVSENSGNATLTYTSSQPSLRDWSAAEVTRNDVQTPWAQHEIAPACLVTRPWRSPSFCSTGRLEKPGGRAPSPRLLLFRPPCLRPGRPIHAATTPRTQPTVP